MRRIDNTIYPMEGGHIRLVDSMGSDSAIVQAARVSYGKGTKICFRRQYTDSLSNASLAYYSI